MNIPRDIDRSRCGFSLAEVLAALTIGAMVLVAVLAIYARVEAVADRMTHSLDSSRLPLEILQRIAEDLDGIVDGAAGVTVIVENKFVRGFQSAQLKIIKNISDEKNNPRTFEEIIWRTVYDYENEANGLILYRSYRGLGFEDKLLDERRSSWERGYPFVPVCDGVTCFKVLAASGTSLLDEWTRTSLPYGINIVISFAEPFEAPDGTLDVPEEEKFMRTVGIGRTRQMRYKFVKREYETEDVNDEAADEYGETADEEVEDANEGTEELGEVEQEDARDM